MHINLDNLTNKNVDQLIAVARWNEAEAQRYEHNGLKIGKSDIERHVAQAAALRSHVLHLLKTGEAEYVT